ncbi:hypothetical protein SESBI_38576 [Sesbania bispinosa]|nr:hypothetical protein SESBI_38576 [Sesbania bispinosa]
MRDRDFFNFMASQNFIGDFTESSYSGIGNRGTNSNKYELIGPMIIMMPGLAIRATSTTLQGSFKDVSTDKPKDSFLLPSGGAWNKSDSKFLAYLMLNPGGIESEGTSMMKVCPYTYFSLNVHHRVDLPPLKSFISSRRRHLKTQKLMKLEALSPRSLKVPHETKKDSDIEQSVFDAKPTYDEIDMDIFIEIYANEKDSKLTAEEEMGKTDFFKEVEDKEDVIFKPTIENKDVTVMLVIPSIIDAPYPYESQIDLGEDLKTSFDYVAIEADTKAKCKSRPPT